MRKLKRRKVIKEYIENQIAKNQRRIQKFSETNFKLRLQLEQLNAMPVQKPLTKADLEARDKAAEEATEAVTDTADQEIGAAQAE